MSRTKNILKNVKEVMPQHCDACGRKYTESDVDIVKDTQQQTMIHINCSGCGNSYILNIYTPYGNLAGTTKAKINLDISGTKELVELAGSSRITIDEALDAFYNIAKTDMLDNYFARTIPNQKQQKLIEHKTSIPHEG